MSGNRDLVHYDLLEYNALQQAGLPLDGRTNHTVASLEYRIGKFSHHLLEFSPFVLVEVLVGCLGV